MILPIIAQRPTKPVQKSSHYNENEGRRLLNSEDSMRKMALRRLRSWTMTILLIILVLLLIGVIPAWPYSRNWGPYPSGGLGLVLLIVVILMLLKVF